MIRRASSIRTTSRLLASAPPRAALARSYATPSQEVDPQLEGYPQLPFIQRGTLPARGWDDMLERRNFGEPIHEQEELLSMWGPDVPVVEPRVAARHFLIAVTGFIAFGFTVKYALTQDPPVIRREYPYNGLIKELGGLEENKLG
ncbi:hypothetical protein EST38_g210 [Candolleomyces aberdarensis]|uniref:Uncharacterized protein n=1 Tax=Candolleomyces aberdarensis TaxID=2316362 RepID=A0A4Q2DYV7_9AGAR|nr:hypothetical protein EST38_g210 [Candolleomyces aberdarensis]